MPKAILRVAGCSDKRLLEAQLKDRLRSAGRLLDAQLKDCWRPSRRIAGGPAGELLEVFEVTSDKFFSVITLRDMLQKLH